MADKPTKDEFQEKWSQHINELNSLMVQTNNILLARSMRASISNLLDCTKKITRELDQAGTFKES